MKSISIGLLVISFVLFSCKSKKQEKDAKAEIPGQWLILYPKHILYTQEAREAYTKAVQDSLVSLYGLKLVGLRSNGEFREGDSILTAPGRWMVKDNGEILIDGGGEGFRDFRGAFDGVRNDTMLISQHLPLPGDTVKVIWYLKRLNDKDAKFFFNLSANWWRLKPDSSESDAVLAKRVKAMLEYYAVYFRIVSNESAYFSQSRVPLPFRYYQHAMDLRPFSDDLAFNAFFYNIDDAKKAYTMLGDGMKKLQKAPFPRGKDFVIEYATYMQMVDTAMRD